MSRLGAWDLLALLQTAKGRGQSLAPALVAQIGIEACHALVRLHRRGMTHGALTPASLLLSSGGEVKLARASELGPAAWYMAPEQARAELVEASADLYALGMILFEAQAGHRARHDDPREAFRQAHRGERLVLQGPLGDTIRRATEPERIRRFRDADEMRQALEIDLVLLPRLGSDLAGEFSALLRGWGVLRSDQQLPGVSHEPTTFTNLSKMPRPGSRGTLAAAVVGSMAGLAVIGALLLSGFAPARRADAFPSAIRCSVHGAEPRCDACPGGDGLYRGSTLNETTIGITLPEEDRFRCVRGVITPE